MWRDVTSTLGAVGMPEGYRLEQHEDGHYAWVHDATGRSDFGYHDKWHCREQAVNDAKGIAAIKAAGVIRGLATPPRASKGSESHG